MLRSRADRGGGLLALSLVLATSGCTFVEGSPWAQIELSLEARFDPAPARLTNEGWLKTVQDYGIAIDAIALGLDEVRVFALTEGAASSTFDPANPPAGYSNCHNGHCHADDGRLVDYEDIAAELAGASAAGEASVASSVTGGALVLDDGPAVAELGECSAGCVFDRGSLDRVEVRASSLRVQGAVHDLRVGDAQRFANAVPFDIEVPLGQSAVAYLEGDIGPGESPDVGLAVTYLLPAQVFDGVDFADAPAADVLDAAVVSAIAEHAALEIEMFREPGFAFDLLGELSQ